MLRIKRICIGSRGTDRMRGLWQLMSNEQSRKIYSRTKKRLLILKDRKCDTCEEARTKALTVEKSGGVSCWNCKAAGKHRRYMVHDLEPHINTKRRWAKIRVLGTVCNTCQETRRMALDVITRDGVKLLRCKNCLRDSIARRYD